MNFTGTPPEIIAIPLVRSAKEVGALRRCLDAEECARADRFLRLIHRDRFVVARAELRRNLGERMGCAPEAVTFHYGPHGKPSVKGLEFNLSHSNSQALLAVGGHRAVGVDIEAVRDTVKPLEIAARFFAVSETDWLHASGTSSECLERFFRLWTLKEALMKATGEGLVLPPREIIFQPDSVGALELVRLWGSPEKASRWECAEWSAPQGYRAAVVVERI